MIMALRLENQWQERLSRHAEAEKLRDSGADLQVKSEKLRSEGNKLKSAGSLLWSNCARAENGNLTAAGSKRWSEGDELWAKGDALKSLARVFQARRDGISDASNLIKATSDKVWAKSVLTAYGDIEVVWKWRNSILDCHLPNDEIYRGDMRIPHD